jgi:hypothetical protein
MMKQKDRIIGFSNSDTNAKALLKRFVDFHWQHYQNEPQHVPLLDYEYLGFKLLGMTGFFEPSNHFFDHAKMRFFLAERNGQIVGRCNAFVNYNHNKHWKDKTGFFGHFESVDDQQVADELITAATTWLKKQGMKTIRGPQNMPVNEATPGIMTDGFQTRPVIYYPYNKKYYEKLIRQNGFTPVKKVMSWEVPVMNPMEKKLDRVSKRVIDRYGVTFETWDERPFKQRRQEMLDIYNDAWNDNWGFVPFTKEEFFSTIDDMKLIMDKGLFLFVYVRGELAGFFGGVPNIFEKMQPVSGCKRCEWLRAARMILLKNKIKGFRLGYMGVRKKFHGLGLDSVMLWKQKLYTQNKGYAYCDIGWVLEDNVLVVRVAEWMQGKKSKTYTVFEKSI